MEKTILLIEDDESLRKSSLLILKKLGLNVSESLTRPGYTGALRYPYYDLVIFDLDVIGHVPERVFIKLQEYLQGIPLLLITNDLAIETAHIPAEFRIAGIIQKPFSPEVLSYQVLQILQRELPTRPRRDDVAAPKEG